MRIGFYSAMGGASKLVDKVIEGARLLGLPE